jgi:hypothetical protein
MTQPDGRAQQQDVGIEHLSADLRPLVAVTHIGPYPRGNGKVHAS